MLSKQQIDWIISKALVPEHIPDMMTYLSDGEAGLFDEDYLFFKLDRWAIFVGYPLSGLSDKRKLRHSINQFISKYHPITLWLVSEEVIDIDGFVKKEQDYYYKLDIPSKLNGNLKRTIRKASALLQVEIDYSPTDQHRTLINEFITNKKLPEDIKRLYLKLPEYVRHSKDTFLLSAYTKKDRVLTAFFVVVMEAKRFSAYMIGCASKTNYVPYASDLLMSELIRLSEEAGKEFINLGIGVNEGIRRFKEKWGGKPFLRYVTSEYSRGNIKRDYMSSSLIRKVRGLLGIDKKIKTLWQVSKDNKTSLLIGSTHMFSHSFVPFLQDIIERVDTVIVEGPLDRERMQQVVHTGMNNTKQSLYEHIDNQTIELLADTYINAYFKSMTGMIKDMTYLVLKKAYISDIRDMIRRYAHWMTYFGLWYMFLDHHNWRHSMDRDAVILAQRKGKDACYLETIEEQIEAMEGIPIDRIVRFLKRADQWEDHIMRFQKIYLKGAMNELLTYTSEFPARCESIIERRDPIMFERMIPYLERGNVLILVGISHIPGITKRLIEAGYSVRDFYEIKSE